MNFKLYNINGFNQDKLIKYKIKLEQSIILRFIETKILNFNPDLNKEVESRGLKFYKISYDEILKGLPILNIKYRQLYNLITPLFLMGFIKRYSDVHTKTLYIRLENLNLIKSDNLKEE